MHRSAYQAGNSYEREDQIGGDPFIPSYAVEEQEGSTAEIDFGRSPFLDEFELDGAVVAHDPGAEAISRFLHELHDDELDETLYELVAEASEVLHGLESREMSSGPVAEEVARTRLTQHFAPLDHEVENLFSAVEEGFATSSVEDMTETEFDRFLDSFTPSTGHLAPPSEDFLKKVWKKAKKTAKKAWKKVKSTAKSAVNRAKQYAMRALWPKLKKAAKALLQRVLTHAIEKIPEQYRPFARTIAVQMGLLKPDGAGRSTSGCGPTHAFFTIQEEVDSLFVGAVEVEDEAVFDGALRAFETHQGGELEGVGSSTALAAARARFVAQLAELEPDDDAAPAIEEFAQAVLMGIRIGVKLIGRPKVVNYLAGHLARLIKRWVGQGMATPLSRVLVDVGMRLLKMEVQPEDEEEAARYALAAFVEDAVRHVARVPESMLATERLFEGHVDDAVRRSAAANLSHALPDSAYRRAPRLRETAKTKGAWVMLPLRGRRRYKKFSRTPRVLITPHIAHRVRTFGGQSLGAFLKQRAGVDPTNETEAVLHLYELVAGGDAADIARGESEVPGLGARHGSWARFHPLTTETAGLLMQEPGLGRDEPEAQLDDPRSAQVGQRLYFMEIPGAYVGNATAEDGVRVIPPYTEVRTTVDVPEREVRVALYLAEPEAQDFLGGMVKGLGARGMHAMGGALRSRLKAGLGQAAKRGLRVLRRGGGTAGNCRASFEASVPTGAREIFADQLADWTVTGLSTELSQRSHEVKAALEHPADGVTLHATIHGPPGMQELEEMMSGSSAAMPADWVAGAEPEFSLVIRPGYSGAAP